MLRIAVPKTVLMTTPRVSMDPGDRTPRPVAIVQLAAAGELDWPWDRAYGGGT